MSVPPSNNPPPGGYPIPPQGGPPPGNYYYGQPPQRPVNNNAGCLKAFGITCGVLLLLGIIGVVLLVRTTGGMFGQFMGIGKDVGNGIRIQRAVVAYHAKNRKYPPNLMSLVADGEIADGKILHTSQDPNPSPGHISWRYTRPPEGAPGGTPILTLPYSITVGNQTQRTDITINLDGSTSSSHNMSSPPAGNSST